MTLSKREKMIVLISNAITLYSKKMEEGILPQNQSVIDFILKSIPEDVKSEITIELIDDIISNISYQ